MKEKYGLKLSFNSPKKRALKFSKFAIFIKKSKNAVFRRTE